MSNKVICDKCNKEFEIKLKVNNHINNIEEAYFKCPNCGEKYISCFTDKNIRLKQKKINKMWEEYKKAPTQEEVVKMAEKITALKAEIKEDIGKLKEKMLGLNRVFF